MPRRHLLALGLLLAALAAGCGKSNPKLISSTRADKLNATVDQITSACDAHDTVKAKAEVALANQQVSALPGSTDSSLRSNLRGWVNHIGNRIDRDCKDQGTPTPTATPSATPSPTPTPTPSPSPTPSPTPTPTPTPTPSASPTVEPPGNGGVSAPE
jgi:outer membrane murein-binding lipoprotein Lpp